MVFASVQLAAGHATRHIDQIMMKIGRNPNARTAQQPWLAQGVGMLAGVGLALTAAHVFAPAAVQQLVFWALF